MSLYKRAGSECWWIDIAHGGRRVRQSSGTSDRIEAQRLHDEVKAELWKTEPKFAGMTWGKAVTVWCDVEVRSESELLSLAKFGRGFPDRLLTQITGDAIDKRPAAFCKTAGTYTRYRTMVAAILNLAKARGWLREVPKLAVRRDKKGAKRHTWATWHVQNGTPLDVLQKLGGWSDLRMVMNYAHHSPSYLAGFADNTRKKT